MNKNQANFDANLLFIIFLFMIISCVSIYSSQKYLPYPDNFAMKQVVWYVAGLVISTAVYFFDFDQIKKISVYLYLFGVMLLSVLIAAPESIAPVTKGAKSWFNFEGIGTIQPSEFMKVFLIVFLAKLIASHNEKFLEQTIRTDLVLICKIVAATLPPLVLILMQPDAGTAMVICIIMIGMLLVSGIHWLIIASMALLSLMVLGVLVYIYVKVPDLLLLFLDPYQLNRIESWLDPFKYREGIGYQLANSILAVGSGTLYGKGFDNAQVVVPEAHSDFIFTIIGEEFGFLGTSIVVGLYFILIYRIIIIALQNKGVFECLIAAGVISMLTFHIFENIGMVIGLVPITGIPLPLLSYGGSSLLGSLLALSLVLNISAKTKRYMFGNNQ
ncbi:rod shape-determining protein RodA [Bacillus canaveralius]|uniref:Rod shape-determining protein RodA n=1 Tax=Bacillus canaveralius TaxID=1403243 RepID=A0A2N5GRY3_9BACI|nr:FtsW/RodA/SpoVE family cell cycle protein [Bacillus canaveralius]PLR86320.1 rod shape-determining protein RodA [Bacillus canaveralius]PLR98553.1 rod shape-determining protein RodA [Bacillus canaveralius]